MTDFVALKCPSCGGKLQITSDIDLFACGYCGTELRVRRGGGIVSLAPVVERLDKVRAGVDKTASELAITRLKSEIPSVESQVREVVDWFRERYPDNRLLRRTGNIDIFVKAIEDDLRSRRTALSREKGGFRLFTNQKAEAAKRREVEILEGMLGKLTSLVATLRDKQSQLRRHEQIVSQ